MVCTKHCIKRDRSPPPPICDIGAAILQHQGHLASRLEAVMSSVFINSLWSVHIPKVFDFFLGSRGYEMDECSIMRPPCTVKAPLKQFVVFKTLKTPKKKGRANLLETFTFKNSSGSVFKVNTFCWSISFQAPLLWTWHRFVFPIPWPYLYSTTASATAAGRGSQSPHPTSWVCATAVDTSCVGERHLNTRCESFKEEGEREKNFCSERQRKDQSFGWTCT